jgi:adenylate cyclase
VKGKSVGVAAFEPLKNGAPQTIYLDAYRAAFAAMARRSPEAGAAFERLAADHPDDRLVAFHRDRLAEGQTGAQIVLEGK